MISIKSYYNVTVKIEKNITHHFIIFNLCSTVHCRDSNLSSSHDQAATLPLTGYFPFSDKVDTNIILLGIQCVTKTK